MKQKVVVVFTVDASNKVESADAFVDRLLRYGFNGIQEYEASTVKALKSWRFAKPVKKAQWK